MLNLFFGRLIMLSLYNFIHIISAVIWVGGMFFAYNFLRPAAGESLNPPERLTVWLGVFKRFFLYVWISVVLLPLSGYLMIFMRWDSIGNAPLYVHIMNGLGTLMIIIYTLVYFSPYQKLKQAVAEQCWPDGGSALAKIRMLVAINTTLGVIVILVASAGRFYVG